ASRTTRTGLVPTRTADPVYAACIGARAAAAGAWRSCTTAASIAAATSTISTKPRKPLGHYATGCTRTTTVTVPRPTNNQTHRPERGTTPERKPTHESAQAHHPSLHCCRPGPRCDRGPGDPGRRADALAPRHRHDREPSRLDLACRDRHRAVAPRLRPGHRGCRQVSGDEDELCSSRLRPTAAGHARQGREGLRRAAPLQVSQDHYQRPYPARVRLPAAALPDFARGRSRPRFRP